MGAGVLFTAPRLIDSSSVSLLLRPPVPHWREFKSARRRTQLAGGVCSIVPQIITRASCDCSYPTVTLRAVSPCTLLTRKHT